jgi:molybdenum cofactor synthesis domain-containing protein
MRPITNTLLFDDALRMVIDAAVRIESVERVDLGDADGRVAARDVLAHVDVPPFDRAAMDGYAVVAADTFGASAQTPRTLVCVDRVFTGQMPSRAVASGECIEISTGAPMPDGADAVVMVEETERVDPAGRDIRILTPVYPRQHVGRRGADLASGQTVVAAGHVLTPSRVGALAATGVTTVEVYARPSVAILSTGNEIAEPGQPLAPGQIYDINRFTLEAVVKRHGGVAVALPTAIDTLDDLSASVDAARGHDVIVFSGGSSVGERDLILDLLRQRGEVLFHGIAVKPGKPTAFGRIGSTPVLGMPGYPTS